MQRFVFDGIIRFLKDGNIIRAAFVQIAVIFGIDRINFQAYHTKVIPCQLTCFPNIGDIAHTVAFPGQNQYLLHAGIGDYLHFVLNLLHRKLHPADLVIAVKAAVNTVILTVIGNIKRCKQIHGIAELLLRFPVRPRRHLFQKRFGGRRKERFQILNTAGRML